MVVLLQRQSRAGLYHDALDLIARASVDGLIVAPRPVRADVLGRLAALVQLQLLEKLLDLVAMLPAHHQHRIVGGNDDHIVNADHLGEVLVRADVHVARPHHHAVPAHRIALRVKVGEFPHRRQVADI